MDRTWWYDKHILAMTPGGVRLVGGSAGFLSLHNWSSSTRSPCNSLHARDYAQLDLTMILAGRNESDGESLEKSKNYNQ